MSRVKTDCWCFISCIKRDDWWFASRVKRKNRCTSSLRVPEQITLTSFQERKLIYTDKRELMPHLVRVERWCWMGHVKGENWRYMSRIKRENWHCMFCKERDLTLQESCKKRELILRDSCKERTNAAGVVFMKTIFPGLYLPWSDAQFVMTVDAVHDWQCNTLYLPS